MSVFEEIKAREYASDGARGEIISRAFGLALALQFTRLFVLLRLDEDAAMLAMWLVGMFGALALAAGGAWLPVGFAALFLHYILDYCDGHLARQHGTSSLVAGVRDRWIHFTVQASTFVALGHALWERHESVWMLLAPALCYVWFQWRLMFAALPSLMYCAEFSGYPPAERRIILANHESTLTEEGGGGAAGGDSPRSPPPMVPRLRHELREVAINFDGFNLVMFFVALVALPAEAYLAPQVGLAGVDVVACGLWLFVAFYALNVLDYTFTYLFTNRIHHDIRTMESRLRGARDRH